jgi:predicted dehydrogenase
VTGYRVAIVGCGGWAAQAHLPALRALPGVEVIACADQDAAASRSFAAAHGIPHWFDSADGLLAAGLADALTVAAPDDVHPSVVLSALAAGVPVFCEKPIANTAETADELVRAQARAGVAATVGYSFRYSPALQQLRTDLAAGLLGEPWLAELYEYNAQFHPRFGKAMNWKGDPDRAGAGALFEYGSHALDLAQWLIGPIGRVSAQLSRVLPGSRLDDIATVQLDFAGPCSGILVSGWVLAGGVPGVRVRVHGSAGAAEAELGESLPGGERYQRLSLDGGPAEPVPLGEEAGGRSGYARRHLHDFLGLPGGPGGRGTLPTLAQAASVQHVLDTAARATERWLPVPGPGGRPGDRPVVTGATDATERTT